MNFQDQVKANETQQQERLVFGWVSDSVQSNFAAWSSWKQYGNQSDADPFFNSTRDEAESQGLTWFCYEEA